jgi:outer membrane immunogenic protein
VSYSANKNYTSVEYLASVSSTKVGWAVGGGVEYAFSRCWTIKAEYLYMDLGSEYGVGNPIPPGPPYQMGYTWETTANIFQIGVNYKF